MVVVNHVSHVDPLTVAHFLYDHGRLPRYLAKEALFRNRVLELHRHATPGRSRCERLSEDAAERVRRRGRGGPRRRVRRSSTPRARITRTPTLWPMRGKTGAARIALATGCPVIPVGQWGAQDILRAVHPAARTCSRASDHAYKVGDPVDLDDLRGAAAHHRGAAARPPTGSWPRSPRWWRTCAARRRPPSASTRAAPASAEIGNPNKDERAARERGTAMTARSRCSAPGRGARRSRLVLADAGNDVTLWAPPRGGRRGDQRASTRTPSTSPASSCPPRCRATTTPRRRSPAPSSSCSPMPSQTLRENLAAVGRRASPDDAVFVSLMKGVELGTTQADERGDRRGHRRRPGADRRGQRAQPRPRDRPREPAASVVACADEDGRAAAAGPAATRRRSGPTRSTDVLGCELGGAYKNVVGARASAWPSASASATTPRPR